jgi:Tfp pilus assembly protein PilN
LAESGSARPFVAIRRKREIERRKKFSNMGNFSSLVQFAAIAVAGRYRVPRRWI